MSALPSSSVSAQQSPCSSRAKRSAAGSLSTQKKRELAAKTASSLHALRRIPQNTAQQRAFNSIFCSSGAFSLRATSRWASCRRLQLLGFP